MEKITEMFKEGGVYSLTRVLPTIGYFTFIIVSVYLAFVGKLDYITFAATTGGIGSVTVLGNKVVNSKWNTPQGEIGKKL